MHRGELSLMEVFKQEHHSVKLATWGYRFIGFFLMFLGTTCTAPLLQYAICKCSKIICMPAKLTIALFSFQQPILGLHIERSYTPNNKSFDLIFACVDHHSCFVGSAQTFAQPRLTVCCVFAISVLCSDFCSLSNRLKLINI